MNIGIYGYGNLGKGVELAVEQQSDMELVGIFTRRPPLSVISATGAPVYSAADVMGFKSKIDVMIICGGSASDLPEMTPRLAKNFNVIDSYDCHDNISAHFASVDRAAKDGQKLALISCGWDPGLFSVMRSYASAVLPHGMTYTFWGRGVSQGHSDAVRRIRGVKDAREYTIPNENALSMIRSGQMPSLTKAEMHKRECFVVGDDNADFERIECEIKTMPGYFAGYDTAVTFITEDEMRKNHSEMMHGGTVIRTGTTDGGHTHTMELDLRLSSNPEFTGSVLTAYARAVFRIANRGITGCVTVPDIPPSDLLPDGVGIFALL